MVILVVLRALRVARDLGDLDFPLPRSGGASKIKIQGGRVTGQHANVNVH